MSEELTPAKVFAELQELSEDMQISVFCYVWGFMSGKMSQRALESFLEVIRGYQSLKPTARKKT